jgi:hypothetical protein
MHKDRTYHYVKVDKVDKVNKADPCRPDSIRTQHRWDKGLRAAATPNVSVLMGASEHVAHVCNGEVQNWRRFPAPNWIGERTSNRLTHLAKLFERIFAGFPFLVQIAPALRISLRGSSRSRRIVHA